MTSRLLAVLALAALSACMPSLIPGTQVEDTIPNRAIYGVMRSYAEALQRKDFQAVLDLAADDYFDTSGTPAPEDDLDRAGLEKALAADFKSVDSLRVEIGVKRIDVTPDGDRATAQLFYDGSFRVLTPTGPVAKRSSDLHLMQFRRVGATWKITAGL